MNTRVIFIAIAIGLGLTAAVYAANQKKQPQPPAQGGFVQQMPAPQQQKKHIAPHGDDVDVTDTEEVDGQ